MRIGLHRKRTGPIHHKMDLGFGILAANRLNRQGGMNNIPQRSLLDNENFHTLLKHKNPWSEPRVFGIMHKIYKDLFSLMTILATLFATLMLSDFRSSFFTKVTHGKTLLKLITVKIKLAPTLAEAN